MSKRKRGEMSSVRNSEAAVNEVEKVTNDLAVDRFSSLPDNIISRIFSYLTMKEALGTCMLCKQLMHLWTMIPNLEFKESTLGVSSDKSSQEKKRSEFIQIVNKFLECNDRLIRSFRLSFNIGTRKNDVLRWISLVMKSGIQELELNFRDLKQYPPMELPYSYFTTQTLKVLKLRSCIFNPPSDFTGFNALKSLLLGCMRISKEAIRAILCNCHSLKGLILQNCRGFTNIEIGDLNIRLKSLTVGGCSQFSKLDAPHLENFGIRSEKIEYSVMEVLNFKKVIICRTSNVLVHQREAQNMTVNVVNKMVNVKSLCLTGWAFKCFAADRAMDDMNFIILGIEKLELEMCLWNLRELNGLALLLRKSNGLTNLIISINDEFADEEDYANYDGAEYDLLTEDYWEDTSEIELAHGCLNKSLQWIEINGFTGEDMEVSFIKFVVAKTQWLRTITINPVKEMETYQRLGFVNLFKRFPKGCRDTKVVVTLEN